MSLCQVVQRRTPIQTSKQKDDLTKLKHFFTDTLDIKPSFVIANQLLSQINSIFTDISL